MGFVLSGCVIRSIPYDVDRADQEIKGNRGVVRGDVSSVPVAERKKTKRLYNIEIELPMGEYDKSKKDRDSSLSGNRGYMQASPTYEEKTTKSKKQESAVKMKSPDVSSGPQVVYQMPASSEGDRYKKEKGSGSVAKKEEKTYIVKKGDTLQKISNKMYGTTKRWKKIYEANKDALKSPDMIKPGQKLIIPAE